MELSNLLNKNINTLEIIDDKYRVLTSDGSNYKIEPYVLKTYWSNNEYIEKKLEVSTEFSNLKELTSK